MEEADVIKLLKEATEAINFQAHLEQGLHAVIDLVRKVLQARTIAVVLTDPESEYLKIKISHGLSKTFVDTYRRRVGTGVIGETIWAGKPILIEHAKPSDPSYAELKLEQDFGSAMCAPLIAQFRPLGYLYCDSVKPDTFDEEALSFLRLAADLAAASVDKDRIRAVNRRLCRLDEKTLILQFSAFYEDLEKELRRELRYGEPLSLLLLDINNFKEWKNLYGAEAASKLFEDVVHVVKNCVRGMDIIARYGVDEVIICCPKADADGAERLADRISDFVENHRFEHDEPKTSVSIGLATVTEEKRNPKSLLEAVRTALLCAQRQEKRKVCAL